MSKPEETERRPAIKSWAGVATIIVTIILAACAQIYSYGGLNSRVAALEQSIRPLSDGSLSSTLARLDERTALILRSQERKDREEDRH